MNGIMIGITIATAVTAVILLRRMYQEENWKVPVIVGTILYLTCPYRIYVCHDLVDFRQAIVWMLLPLYTWAVIGLLQKKALPELVIAALALAGIGYAESVFFVILAGITLLVGVFKRNIWIFVSLIGGAVVFAPGLYRFLQYLFTERFAELNIHTELIMKNGYRFGEFFSAYTWKEGHPGMGLGLLICLLAGIWLKFVKGESRQPAASKWLLLIAVVAAGMSLRCFPWDFVQRLGVWALRFVTLMKTPAFLWGLSCGALSVVGAGYVGELNKNENRLIAVAVPIIVVLFCIASLFV